MLFRSEEGAGEGAGEGVVGGVVGGVVECGGEALVEALSTAVGVASPVGARAVGSDVVVDGARSPDTATSPAASSPGSGCASPFLPSQPASTISIAVAGMIRLIIVHCPL